VKPAEAVVPTRREPGRQEIYNKIREVVGLGGPEEFLSDFEEEEDLPADHLGEEACAKFPEGRGPAWEEEQRREREQEQKGPDSESVSERDD
jgi:hypothetical protein